MHFFRGRSSTAESTSPPSTPSVQLTFKEPSVSISFATGGLFHDQTTRHSIPIYRRRRKSSLSSISKSSISRPTSQASSYSALPTLDQPQTWKPSSGGEPAFECPRPSPVPPQGRPAYNAPPSPSQPIRPTSSLEIPRPRMEYRDSIRRASSLKSDVSQSTVFEIDEESEEEPELEPKTPVDVVVKAVDANEPMKSPTSPTIRKNIFKPVKIDAGQGEGYRAMTVWERIGERRAREMGDINVW